MEHSDIVLLLTVFASLIGAVLGVVVAFLTA